MNHTLLPCIDIKNRMCLFQENGDGCLVYADIGVLKPKKASPHQVIPAAEDRVVYSAIDTKATAKQQQKKGT